MAIQIRRGEYADYDAHKMVPGELAAILSGDPATRTGRSVRVCFGEGTDERLITDVELQEEVTAQLNDAFDDYAQDFVDDVNSATLSANSAASSANSAASSANSAASAASVAAEAANEAAEAYEQGLQSDIQTILGDFATAESSSVASVNYAVGQYLIYNKILYKVTSAISAGASLAVGTNIAKTTVGAELKTLTDNMSGLTSTKTVLSLGTLSLNFQKVGNFVHVSFSGDVGTTLDAGSTTVGTLPEAYRPKWRNINAAVYSSASVSGGAEIQFVVFTDGQVVLHNFGTAFTGWIRFDHMYPLAA